MYSVCMRVFMLVSAIDFAWMPEYAVVYYCQLYFLKIVLFDICVIQKMNDESCKIKKITFSAQTNHQFKVVGTSLLAPSCCMVKIRYCHSMPFSVRQWFLKIWVQSLPGSPNWRSQKKPGTIWYISPQFKWVWSIYLFFLLDRDVIFNCGQIFTIFR